MAIVAPFRGLTYDYHHRKDLSKLVAPPYDVISPEEQEQFYQADPCNVIRLILGKKRTGDSDWDNRYTRAADDFQRWQSNGTLIHSDEPFLCLTAMTFRPGNGDPEQIRWGLIGLVKIEDEGSGVILPHEQTFSAHKDDRLKLFRACNAQFSQIFALYEDEEDVLLKACREAADDTPQMDFHQEDGTRHRLWMLKKRSLFRFVHGEMAPKTLFIADGHHRYETSRNYRNMMRARHGIRPAHRAYEYVMMYLSNMNDPGLIILPTHRLITRVPDFDPKAFLNRVQEWFQVVAVEKTDEDLQNRTSRLREKLEQMGKENPSFAFLSPTIPGCHILTLRQGAQMGEDLHPSLQRLDVLVLSRLVLEKALGLTREDLDNEKLIHYQSSMLKAVRDVEAGEYQMGFLLNPTRKEHVREVARNGLIMPRKSTYFFPKVLTGLVFNKIHPHEIIQHF